VRDGLSRSTELTGLSHGRSGRPERRAIFGGRWPPTFWLIGDSVQRARRRQALTC